MSQSSNIESLKRAFAAQGYIMDDELATVVYLALSLEKPLLVEGPAGVGKTELAKAMSRTLGYDLIRLQCYEGLDEQKALYEWDYQKQLLFIQSLSTKNWSDIKTSIYTSEFLLPRPLLRAITSQQPVVLLVDELDKSDEAFESFLFEILSDFQVSIPEFGTLKANARPLVVLTSNSTREFSEALKRRCLHLYINYPDYDRELQILKLKVPESSEELQKQVASYVQRIRKEKLRKPPGISETIDFLKAIITLAATGLTPEICHKTLPVLIKYRSDQEKLRAPGKLSSILESLNFYT